MAGTTDEQVGLSGTTDEQGQGQVVVAGTTVVVAGTTDEQAQGTV